MVIFIQLKNFVVYKSSAGSGKTFTLVKEYLKLSLYDDKKLNSNYKGILAITFTNKAAAEMKSRVLDALQQISTSQNLPFLGKLLLHELNITESELKRRAAIVLSHILHHYSDFSIGTIDSFTHKIVKTFAFDLKLPINFNIELDIASFYERVIAQLFSKVGEDQQISKLLKEFVLNKAEDNKSWDPQKALEEFSKLLQRENSSDYINKIKHLNTSELENIRQQFVDYQKHYSDTLKFEANKALDLIHQNGLTDEDFIYKKSGPQNYFTKCYNNDVNKEDGAKPRLSDALTHGKWANKTSSNSNKVEKIASELSLIASNLREFIDENYHYYSLCEILGKQMYPLMLLKKIEEISEEQKNEDSLVFISEFNQRIFEVIQNEPTPFIYERLGERYRHYLIDEFQDTSNMQWQNMLPLIDNSLANGWFNMLVGDGKQSIYRWRNASVKQFAILPEIENINKSSSIQERQNTLHRNYEERILNTNFRSLNSVVTFNNHFFSFLKHSKLNETNQFIYNEHEQLTKTKDKNEEGYVSYQFEAIDRDELDTITCNTIKQHIEDSLTKDFDYKDICILTRNNSHGHTVAHFLKEQGIPVISSDSLLLKNNLEVNTIICYLRYLLNSNDKVSAAAVLNYLRHTSKIDTQTFHLNIVSLKTQPLGELLKQCNILLNESELSLNNLFDNCIELINALHMHDHSYHYLRFFLDQVNEFLALKNSNLNLFFDWWETRSKKASVIIPDGINAVKVMTIHASKGLEFPIVIVPYCTWSIYKAGDNWVEIHNENIKLPVGLVAMNKKAAEAGFSIEYEIEQQQQVLDNINLLYVAFTRAVERLHILAFKSDGARNEGVDAWMNAYVQSKAGSENLYEFGTKHPKLTSSHHTIKQHYSLNQLDFTTNSKAVKLKATYLNNSSSGEKARQEGILIHWLLSKIKTKADVEEAFKDGIIQGIISAHQELILKKLVLEVIEHPQLREFFVDVEHVKNEVELYNSIGVILRPDKLILDNNSATIIDFKTGKVNRKRHAEQLTAYESTLKELGYTQIKKLLVYIDGLNVIEVN